MEILARRTVNFAALFLVLIFCPGLVRAQPSSGMFDAITPVMNTARENATATLLPNGKVLIAGGFLSSTELYDPVTNTFAAPASTPVMNTARGGATATLLNNGKVLIAGGSDNATNLSSTELYDPATNTFAASASTPVMNTAREFATATLLPNGKVLIAGGFGIADILSSTELYDPATNTFAPSNATPAMNSPRVDDTATLLPNGKVLIAGGFDGNFPSLSSTELYDSATNTFAPSNSTAVMNGPREDATATLLGNGKVLIAGGQIFFQDFTNTTELYDPATNTFAPSNSTANVNTPRVFATATLLPDGKVLIAGGQNLVAPHLYNSLSSTELYDPASNSFAASTPAMNVARDSATATLLPNNKVLIAGGESVVGGPPNTTLLSSTELYSPSTVSITNPAADSTVSATVAFSCTDTAPGAVVGLYIDDVYVAAGNSPFTFSWDTTSASNGNHYLVCNGYVNGSTNGSAAENVTVNNLTPPTPTISITNPPANSTVSATVAFSCTDTAPDATVILYIDDVYVAGGNSPLTFSWDTTAASNGSHYLVCNGYVNGGTNGSAAENVTVSN
jgi:hypothetical protein